MSFDLNISRRKSIKFVLVLLCFLSATLLIQRMWMSFNLHVKRIFYRIENKNVSIGNIYTLNKLCKSKNTNRSYSKVFTMNYWRCLRWINHCYCCCSLSVLCLCCSPKSLRFKPKKMINVSIGSTATTTMLKIKAHSTTT